MSEKRVVLITGVSSGIYFRCLTPIAMGKRNEWLEPIELFDRQMLPLVSIRLHLRFFPAIIPT